MRAHALCAVTFMLVSVAACSPSGGRMQAAKAEEDIRALVKRLNDMVAAQNDSGVTALYADDAVIMPDRAPMVSGHEAIAQMWKGFLAGKPNLTISPTDITVAEAGDLAVERGTYQLSFVNAQGTTSDHGKYVVTWKPMADGWRMTTDIWNSDILTPEMQLPDTVMAVPAPAPKKK